MSRAEVDAAKQQFTQLHDLLREAYDAWWPSVIGSVLSVVQDPNGPGASASTVFWDQYLNPVETMSRAVLSTLGQWPAKLEEAFIAYQAADSVSADDLFVVHDEL